MKKAIGCIVAVVLISASLACAAEGIKEPAYRSKKPLYAAVVLDEAGTKVLTLAFDESAGTGKGYDTLYADVNVNGDLTDEKAIKGTLLGQGGWRVSCAFSPIVVDVPYNEKAKGVAEPWRLTFNYYQFTRTKLFGLVRGETYRQSSFEGQVRLKDESWVWQYSFSSSVELAKSLAEASPIAFRGKPMLQVETKRDPQKKGNTGIAAHLRMDTNLFRCFKGDQPITGHVEIKDEEQKTVHSEDVSSDRLVFG